VCPIILTESDLALLLWSPDATKSNWTKEEWTAILARQVAEQKIRLGNSAGGGAGAAQEGRSDLPGVGRQERARLLLLAVGTAREASGRQAGRATYKISGSSSEDAHEIRFNTDLKKCVEDGSYHECDSVPRHMKWALRKIDDRTVTLVGNLVGTNTRTLHLDAK